MTAKEYLSRARSVAAEVGQLQRMRQRAWEQATQSTSRLSKAPTHGGNTRDPLAAYAEYSELLEARTAELLTIQSDTLRTIEKVQDGRYRQLLRARYLEGLTWEQIAVRMNYGYQHVIQRLHPKALQAVEEIMR